MGEEREDLTHEQIMARLDEYTAEFREINRRNRERNGTPNEFIGLDELPTREMLLRLEEILRRLNAQWKRDRSLLERPDEYPADQESG